MKYIETLREGDRVSDIYLCKSKQAMRTKAGRTYYSLVLQDKTGTIDTKVWDITAGIEDFDALDFIKVEGQVTIYQNSPQLKAVRIWKAQEMEYDPSDYMPVSEYNIDSMYHELLKFVDSVKEAHLHALLESFFVKDTEFIRNFKQHSAAKSIHHGFVGGLLEHTLSVTKLCDFYCTRYPILNRDLLISAALCHDIGKTKELSEFPANDYTDEGQLIGHIVIGTEMVHDRIQQIEGFPPTLAHELEHCIVSHHGELEYGSPKKPALIEALALNLADNTDAKLETMTEALDNAGTRKGWLGFNKVLDSNIRKTSNDEKK